MPVACAATAADVSDTLLFERPFLTAFAVMARIRTVFADKGYDAEDSRQICRGFGATPWPRLHERDWPVERSQARVLENKRLALRYDRLGVIV